MAKNEVKNNKSSVVAFEKDFNWYLKAAENGDAEAQNEVGNYYYEGKNGIEKDFKKAFEYYMMAALQGFAEAQKNVGWCYDTGEGVEEDKKKAFKWYLKAAEQGNAKAQFEVGCCYDKGEGVEKNTEKAFNWYMKAAEQGLVGAQFAVGGHYFFGLSIEKDEKEGLKWFKKAAEQDNRVKKFVVSLEKNREKDKKTKSELLTAVNEIKKEESNTTNAELFKRLDDIAKDIAEIKTKLSKNNTQIKPETLTAFIIMQFGGVFDTLYRSVITPICEQLRYEPVRADECYGERISEDIVKAIADASLVIADITKDNPNVFYELGYAHALKKPTILLADKNQRDKLPFDTQDYRTIFYENTIDGKEKVENMLRKYMEKYQEKSCIKN